MIALTHRRSMLQGILRGLFTILLLFACLRYKLKLLLSLVSCTQVRFLGALLVACDLYPRVLILTVTDAIQVRFYLWTF